jgi:hypothetical protein
MLGAGASHASQVLHPVLWLVTIANAPHECEGFIPAGSGDSAGSEGDNRQPVRVRHQITPFSPFPPVQFFLNKNLILLIRLTLQPC